MCVCVFKFTPFAFTFLFLYTNEIDYKNDLQKEKFQQAGNYIMP